MEFSETILSTAIQATVNVKLDHASLLTFILVAQPKFIWGLA